MEQLKRCYVEASKSAKRRVERLKDEYVEAEAHDRVMDAVGELFRKVEDMTDEAERKQAAIDDLQEQLDAKQAECDELQRQLLEAENDRLEQERQHLQAEVNAKPMEIHNHFGAGSKSQVFNDKVNGRFGKKEKLTKLEKKEKEKKRWKKIVGKVL